MVVQLDEPVLNFVWADEVRKKIRDLAAGIMAKR